MRLHVGDDGGGGASGGAEGGEGAEGGDTDYAMLNTIIPATPDFAVNPIELGDAPTLAQKWPGEALGTLDALHKEIVELLK